MALNDDLAAALAEARHRTTSILAPYDEAVLRRQHDPLMSPLVWDLAHVANYEDLWLVRALGGTAIPAALPDLDDLYDAFKQPRSVRETLPLLCPADARAYGEAVRARALDLLERADLGDDGPDALRRGGAVYSMVVQHEHQHDETLLAAIQLLPPEEGHRLPLGARPAPSPLVSGEVHVDAGTFTMGTDDPLAYDNERPAHEVELSGFWIDVAPVTNVEYQAFMANGGYDDPRWWHPDGWAWRRDAGLRAPRFWRRDGHAWLRLRFGNLEPVDPHEPVQHVCWYEADAYARWAGKRLPTEAEWERAAAGTTPDPSRANLGQQRLGPLPVGACPEGVSQAGCHQMLGDVWEWTASTFRPHPGFVAFPYDEYSKVFHGDRYRVLRGGSWATHPSACRRTFRNWDLPIRRQIFAGFRCARDAS